MKLWNKLVDLFNPTMTLNWKYKGEMAVINCKHICGLELAVDRECPDSSSVRVLSIVLETAGRNIAYIPVCDEMHPEFEHRLAVLRELIYHIPYSLNCSSISSGTFT